MNAIYLHEFRRCGRPALVLPGAGALGGSVIAALGSGPVPALAAGGGALLFAMVTAMAAVSVLGREMAVELHLAAPTPFAVTVARRLAVLAAVAVLAAAAMLAATAAAGALLPAPGALAGAAAVAGPTLLLSGAGVWAWARWNSGAVAAALVAAVAIAHTAWWEPVVSVWWLNRGVSLAVGLLLLGAALRRLGDEERVLRGERP